jgi:IclR family transcriptional regulator, pca regulon regulatory protein
MIETRTKRSKARDRTSTTRERALPLGQESDQPIVAGPSVLVSDPNYMASLARGLAVLQAFNQQRRMLSISQISQRTGIPRAAVRRCILTLLHLGFVASEDERHFSLRPRVLTLGHAYLASSPLGKAAQPVLWSVRDRLEESASISVLDGDRILYIARAPAARLMVINLDVGSRLPANCTSNGRVLLSQLDAKAVDAYLGATRLVQYTPKTIMSVDALRSELERVREQGYCLIDEELELGLRTLAVPILDGGGKAVAAMSVGAHTGRVSVNDLTERFLPVLREAALEVSLLVC